MAVAAFPHSILLAAKAAVRAKEALATAASTLKQQPGLASICWRLCWIAGGGQAEDHIRSGIARAQSLAGPCCCCGCCRRVRRRRCHPLARECYLHSSVG